MGALWALLRADDATAAYARLDALARDIDADDPRGMDARRADILTDLLLGRDVNGGTQTTVEVQVNLDAATLAGLADNPGELAGFGPIPTELARELAAAARRWRVALIDEQTGQLMDLSVAYRPAACSISPSGPEIRSAASRDAANPRAAATSTTPFPTASTDAPVRAIWERCAATTTGSRPTPAGR